MKTSIIVFNHKYGTDLSSSCPVGATAFTAEVVKAFQELGNFKGLILYKRVEGLTHPQLSNINLLWGNYKSITLQFNFQMAAIDIQNSLHDAIIKLNPSQTDNVMVYYQIETLLPFHPQTAPACVTHHGPLAEHFLERNKNDDAAQEAFGSQQKLTILKYWQKAGLNTLRSRKDIHVLSHSNLQGEILEKLDISPEKIHYLSPPIPGNDYPLETIQLEQELERFITTARDANEVIFTTAVARLDYFKNVDMLVSAVLPLLMKGKKVKVLIFGGCANEEASRQKIITQLPDTWQAHFMITKRLTRPQLYTTLHLLKNTGVFVCTSRYETLGITPLEAASIGICTLMPDIRDVEASRYFPDEYRYRYTVNDLTSKLDQILSMHHTKSHQQLFTSIRAATSLAQFKTKLGKIWQQLSEQSPIEVS